MERRKIQTARKCTLYRAPRSKLLAIRKSNNDSNLIRSRVYINLFVFRNRKTQK